MAKPKTDLAVFKWQGVNRRGEVVTGEQQGKSITVVKAELRRQGIIAKKVTQKREPFFSKQSKKIGAADITIFSRPP